MKRIAILLTLCLLPFLPALVVVSPNYDDIKDLYTVQHLGVLQGAVNYYYTWSGRFSADYLALANKVIAPWLFIALVAVLWWGLLVAVLYAVKRDRWLAIAGASLILLTLLVTCSTLHDTYYWSAGFSAHTCAAISFTALVWLLVRGNSRQALTLAACF